MPTRRLPSVLLALAALIAGTLSTAPGAAAAGHPSSAVTSPAPGARIQAGEQLTITGNAWDGESGGVTGVEVSLDGGQTWAATDYVNEHWSYPVAAQAPGRLTVVSRASTADATEVPRAARTVVVGPNDSDAQGCPCTLWFNDSDYVMASDPDDQAVELGVRFRSEAAGVVTGVSFAKLPGNTGQHLGRLWTADGALLAEITFTDETDEGWQQATFAEPVAIAAGTVYVASYYAPQGRYASTEGHFAAGDFVARPLGTVSSAFDGAGVYRYGEGGGFPDQSWHASSYWVTPVFRLGQ